MNKQTPLLNLAFYASAIILILQVLLAPVGNVLSWDVFGYYIYLPFTFHYNDLTLHNQDNVQHIINTYHNTDTFYQALKLDNGNWVMKYSMGMAIVYSPFYFIGHGWAWLTGAPMDGFSKPYQLSILYGCMLYTIVGLYYFKKVLAHFFEDRVATITFLLIVFATNYMFHVSLHGQGAMSHNILFSLYAIVLWNTIRWHQTYNNRYALALGICTGLLAIIRPTEIIALCIPALYGVTNFSSLRPRLALFMQHKKQVLAIVLIMGIILSYQFWYFKIVTGKFLYNSYSASNPGEGFEFFHPFIAEVLFSFRKGWFIYTPVMLFACIGLFFLPKWRKEIAVSSIVYFLINIYIVSSWSCWWYAGSFSSRALIPSYVVMSLPLGFFITWLWQSRLKLVFIPLATCLCALNLFQSWQMYKGIMDSTRMTRAYYFSIFGQTSAPTAQQKDLLLVDRFTTYDESFSDAEQKKHRKCFAKVQSFADAKNDMHAFETSEHTEFTPAVSESYEKNTKSSYLWVKATCKFYMTQNPDDCDAVLCTNMTHKGYSFKYRDVKIAGKGFKANAWNKISFYYMTPDLRTTKDSIHVFFWNRCKQPIWIDSLGYEAYEPIHDKSVF
ncbi:MAG: hypothetical protein JST26_01590 [Bacteroidetes bacterium]|nr:hypothetical protein [Bacteroidota bacterium]